MRDFLNEALKKQQQVIQEIVGTLYQLEEQKKSLEERRMMEQAGFNALRFVSAELDKQESPE